MKNLVAVGVCALLVLSGTVPLTSVAHNDLLANDDVANPAPAYFSPDEIKAGPLNDELKIALQDDMMDMNLWNPDTNSIWKTDQLQYNFEGLMAFNPDFELYPVLAGENPTGPNGADAWVSGDGMQISINLRQDAAFTDGKPFTSMDVVFSYQTAGWDIYASNVLNPLYHWDGTFAKYDGGTSHIGVEANGTYRVDFFLENPYSMFWYQTLSMPICPWHIWQNHTVSLDPGMHPGYNVTGESGLDYWYGNSLSETDATIGTGPFYLESWALGNGSVVKAYGDYWNKNGTVSCGGEEYPCYPKQVRTIIFEIIPQLDDSVAALRNGSVHHIAASLSPAYYNMMKIDPNIGFETPDSDGFFYICFNLRKGAMTDVNFRRAVAYCVDKDYIVDNIMDGYGSPGSVPISITSQIYVNTSVPDWIAEGNLTKAMMLLDASGYVDYDGDGWRDMPDHSPLRYDILTPPMDYDPVRANAGILIESKLRAVGLNVASVPTDFDTIVSSGYVSLDFDMFILGWSVGLFPETYLWDFFHGDSDIALNPYGTNAAGYHNASVDSMIDALQTEMDNDARAQLVKDICGATMMDVVYDTLYYKKGIEAYLQDAWQGWLPVLGSIYNRFSVCNLTPPSYLYPSYGNLEVGVYVPDNIRAGANRTCYVLVTDNDQPVDNAHIVVQTNLGVTLDGYTNLGGCVEFDYHVPFAEGQAFFSANATKGVDTGGAFKVSSLFTDKSFASLSLSTQNGVVSPLGNTTVTARATDREGMGVPGALVDVDTALLFGSVDSAQKTTDSLGFANFTYTAPPASYMPNSNRYEQFRASVSVADTVVQEVQEACLVLAIANNVRDWHSVDIVNVDDYVISGNKAGTLQLTTDVTVSVVDATGASVIGTTVYVDTDNSVAIPDSPSHVTNGAGEVVFTLSAVDGTTSRSTKVDFHVNKMYSTSDCFLLLNHNETDPTGGYAADIDFEAKIEHGSSATVTATVYDETGNPAPGVPCQFFIPPTAEGIPGQFQGGDEWIWWEYGTDWDLGWSASYIGSWYGNNASMTDGTGRLVATISTPSFIADTLIPLEFGIGGYWVTETFNKTANNWWMEDYGDSGNWVPPTTDWSDGNYYWRAADFTLVDSAILWRGPAATMTDVNLGAPYLSSEDQTGTITMTFQNESGALANSNVKISEGIANPPLLDEGPTDGAGMRSYLYDSGTGQFDAGMGFTSMVTEPGYSQFPFTFYLPYVNLPDKCILTVEPSAKLVAPNGTVNFTARLTDIFGIPIAGATIWAGTLSNTTDALGIAGFSKTLAGAGIQNTSFTVTFGGKTGSMTAGVIVGEVFSLTTHLPIRINSNADFDEAHGVVNWATGNGTQGNPWIIEGWDVNGTGYGYCIYIGNTTEHFIVSNCYLHEASGFMSPFYFFNQGLILYHTTNGTIENIIAYGNGLGVQLCYSPGNDVINNSVISNVNEGIWIHDSRDVLVSGNNVTSNEYGIDITISDGAFVVNNTASNNNVGISASQSDAIIVNNIATMNLESGISVGGPDSIYFINNNTISMNNIGITLSGTIGVTVKDNAMLGNSMFISGVLEHWNSHDIDVTNTVNGKPVRYWKNQVGGTVPPGAGQVILANCMNVTVEGQNLINGSVGILMGLSVNNIITDNNASLNNLAGIYMNFHCNGNLITGNIVSNNYDGICMDPLCDGNTISNNTANSNSRSSIYLLVSDDNVICDNVISNSGIGVYLYVSEYNIIARNTFLYNGFGIYSYIASLNKINHNNFINNTEQAFDEDYNQWDDGYPSGGNYWSDYNGTDAYSGPGQNESGSDGIGDTPYLFTGDQDNYPLMTPWTPPVLLEFTIPLSPGWNLVSIPLEMASTDISTALASISGQYDVVKYYSSTDASDPWKTYRPGSPTNDLASIDRTMGLWIHGTAYCNLTVTGEIPATTQILLHAGWNLVGYPSMTEQTVANALWGTGAYMVEAFDPGSPYLISEIGPTYMMKPGEGYWIHVPADTVWTVNW